MYRQDPITKKWVIFAPHRALRPKTATDKIATKCPFCAGPHAPDREVFQVNNNHKGWEQYVLANKYPAVQSFLEPDRHKDKSGKLSIDGFGNSEVIVETADHNYRLVDRTPKETQKLFRLYKDRMVENFKDPRVRQVIIFKNSGPKAGASQPHPHSQVYALPIVPGHIRIETDYFRRFYDDEGMCPTCDLLNREFRENKRLLLNNDSVVAICPYASENSYEVHLYPKDHVTSLTLIGHQHLDELADAAGQILRALKHTLGAFDYNLIFDSAPKDDCDAPFFHLRLKIIPRLSTPAGFEIASQMAVNSTAPELAAEKLKTALRKDI